MEHSYTEGTIFGFCLGSYVKFAFRQYFEILKWQYGYKSAFKQFSKKKTIYFSVFTKTFETRTGKFVQFYFQHKSYEQLHALM